MNSTRLTGGGGVRPQEQAEQADSGGIVTESADRPVMLEQALRHHEAGRLDRAQALYQRILDAAPNDADALHLLGIVAHQSGNHALAVEYITQAIDINPAVPLYHNNLGSAYRELKRFDEAGRSVAQSIALKPDSADAHYNLGVILSDCGRQTEAEPCFRQAISLRPDFAQAHYNLGILVRRAGRYADAIGCFQQVLRLDPGNAVARFLHASVSGCAIERAPDQYVAGVFDSDAEKFDELLVATLRYDTPQRLLGMCGVLLRNAAEKKDVLDLGCGTGLAGIAFAPYARYMVGADLSVNMLARAQARALYQRLEHAELRSMMQGERSAAYDVVVAADVFIYSGRLDEIFAEVKRLLRGGGLFAFSVESLDALSDPESGMAEPPADGINRPGVKEYRLNACGRFAHASSYIHALALTCGFRVNTMLMAPTRLEDGKAVQAWLVLLENDG